jgi:hypothetical protein
MDDVLLLTCPKCEIMITVDPLLCLEGKEFPCPICQEPISFKMTPQELEERLVEERKKRDRDLKRHFRLAFGDV